MALQFEAWTPLVKNGLAVTSDQGDLRWSHSKMPASGNRGPGKELSQAKIQLAERARDDRVLFSDAKNFPSKRRRKFDRCVAKQLCVEVRGRARDARQRNVDSIRGCSRHHAENEHGLVIHEICFFSSARRLSASRGFNWSRLAPRSFSSTSRSSAVKSIC